MAGEKIAVSGASGFIGKKLCHTLKESGYQVVQLVRERAQGSPGIYYDYNQKSLDEKRLSECSAVIHLAGKNIMSSLWTKKVKQELYDSRVKSTRFLAHSLSRMEIGPKILLNASAVGIYGDQRDLKLAEDSHAGTGFLAKLCVDWERSTLFSKSAGLRVVNMRFGTVLDRDGGMLKFLAPVFRLGLGGAIGSGAQYLSYVTRDELVRQILFVLKNDEISGPVNMVAKEPITNEEFSEALASVFHRKTLFRIPAFMFKLLGEQGKMLLDSARVYPKVLLDNRFPFAKDHNIETTLKSFFAS